MKISLPNHTNCLEIRTDQYIFFICNAMLITDCSQTCLVFWEMRLILRRKSPINYPARDTNINMGYKFRYVRGGVSLARIFMCPKCKVCTSVHTWFIFLLFFAFIFVSMDKKNILSMNPIHIDRLVNLNHVQI